MGKRAADDKTRAAEMKLRIWGNALPCNASTIKSRVKKPKALGEGCTERRRVERNASRTKSLRITKGLRMRQKNRTNKRWLVGATARVNGMSQTRLRTRKKKGACLSRKKRTSAAFPQVWKPGVRKKKRKEGRGDAKRASCRI